MQRFVRLKLIFIRKMERLFYINFLGRKFEKKELKLHKLTSERKNITTPIFDRDENRKCQKYGENKRDCNGKVH